MLRDKIDELAVKVKQDSDFRQSHLLCFTETWLKEDFQDISLNGYTMIRADRDKDCGRRTWHFCGL